MNNVYETYKDDVDPILTTKLLELEKTTKLLARIQGIPFYQTDLNGLLALSIEKIEAIQEQKKHISEDIKCILPIDPYRFVWLTKKEKYTDVIKNSLLNIPDGGGISFVSRLFNQEITSLVAIDDYVMSIIQLCNIKRYTIFFLGENNTSLETLVSNLKKSYSNLPTVGKYAANIKNPNISEKIKEGIMKSNPNIVLLGASYKKSLDFILKYQATFSKSRTIFIILGSDFKRLTDKRKLIPSFFIERNLIWLWNIIKNPFIWYRFFFVLYFFFLGFKKIFKKR